MDDTQFHDHADNLMQHIEDTLDHYATTVNIDYERSDGIMTLIFANQRKILLNRHIPLQQIWLATPTQGYHFAFHHTQWRCVRSHAALMEILSSACSQEAGCTITFPPI